MTRRKWKVGKVLKYLITIFLFLFTLSFCPPSNVQDCIFDYSDWQLCRDTCVCLDCVHVVCVLAYTYVCVFIECLAAFCVYVLADSSVLSQSSATEEMPPLLPSPQSSPASKFIHGNQKLYGHPWQGPNTPTLAFCSHWQWRLTSLSSLNLIHQDFEGSHWFWNVVDVTSCFLISFFALFVLGETKNTSLNKGHF